MQSASVSAATRKRFFRLFAACIAGVSLLGDVDAARGDFSTGMMVVVRIGDGSTAVSSTAAQRVSLLTYDIRGASPSLLSTTNFNFLSTDADRFVLSGTSTADEGRISLSDDGQYLTLAGYRSNSLAASPATASVGRVVARVDSSMGLDTSTVLTNAFNGVSITSAVSLNGSQFWVAGGNGDPSVSAFNGGLRYVPNIGSGTNYDVSRTQTGANTDSYRSIRMIDGKLIGYAASQGSFTNRGAYNMTISGGLPIVSSATPSTANPVIINTEGAHDWVDQWGNIDFDYAENPVTHVVTATQQRNGKQYPKTDGVFLDLNKDGLRETAYTTGSKGDVEKWYYSVDSQHPNGQWIRTGSLYLKSLTSDILAIDTYDTGGNISLLVSTTGALYKIDDTNRTLGSTFNIAGMDTTTGTFTPTDTTTGQPLSYPYTYYTVTPTAYLTTGTTAYQFRGLAVVPEPETIALLGLSAGALLLGRKRKKTHQCAFSK